ncbi:MAG: hypothetical protein ABIJ09_20685 [Pseudomonadota bacterium]
MDQWRPKLGAGFDPLALDLSVEEAYLLSLIDGRTSLAQLRELSDRSHEEVVAALQHLVALGVVDGNTAPAELHETFDLKASLALEGLFDEPGTIDPMADEISAGASLEDDDDLDDWDDDTNMDIPAVATEDRTEQASLKDLGLGDGRFGEPEPTEVGSPSPEDFAAMEDAQQIPEFLPPDLSLDEDWPSDGDTPVPTDLADLTAEGPAFIFPRDATADADLIADQEPVLDWEDDGDTPPEIDLDALAVSPELDSPPPASSRGVNSPPPRSHLGEAGQDRDSDDEDVDVAEASEEDLGIWYGSRDLKDGGGVEVDSEVVPLPGSGALGPAAATTSRPGEDDPNAALRDADDVSVSPELEALLQKMENEDRDPHARRGPEAVSVEDETRASAGITPHLEPSAGAGDDDAMRSLQGLPATGDSEVSEDPEDRTRVGGGSSNITGEEDPDEDIQLSPGRGAVGHHDEEITVMLDVPGDDDDDEEEISLVLGDGADDDEMEIPLVPSDGIADDEEELAVAFEVDAGGAAVDEEEFVVELASASGDGDDEDIQSLLAAAAAQLDEEVVVSAGGVALAGADGDDEYGAEDEEEENQLALHDMMKIAADAGRDSFSRPRGPSITLEQTHVLESDEPVSGLDIELQPVEDPDLVLVPIEEPPAGPELEETDHPFPSLELVEQALGQDGMVLFDDLRTMPLRERFNLVRQAEGTLLRALCLDPNPRVICELIGQPSFGIEHACLVARWQTNPEVLNELQLRDTLVADSRVQVALLDNPAAPGSMIAPMLDDMTAMQLHQLCVREDLAHESRVAAAYALRDRYAELPPHQRVELIFMTEGECLLLAALPVDEDVTDLLCGQKFASPTLIANLASYAGTPMRVLQRLYGQPVVLDNPELKTLLRGNPNWPQ